LANSMRSTLPVCYATATVPYKVTTHISTAAVTTPMARSLIFMVYPSDRARDTLSRCI
jgi:hypothetical protein